MKKILNLALAAALTLGLTSCTKENLSNSPESAGGVVTLVLKGINPGAVTYVASETGENVMQSVDIYRFRYVNDGSGTLCEVTPVTITPTSTTVTARLENLSGGSTEQFIYYVVANGAAAATELGGVAAGTTSEADFVELLTNSQGNAQLTTPLLMTGKSDVATGTTGSVNVTVVRRVARFDLVNNNPKIVIKNVFVSDAKLKGNVFANFAGTPVIPTGSLDAIDATGLTFVTEGTDNIAKSVFYLYPTQIGTGKTQIAIEASYDGGPDKLYYIKPAAAAQIKANSRYKLIVTENLNTVEVGITPESEWDDDAEYEFEAGSLKVLSIVRETGASDWTFDIENAWIHAPAGASSGGIEIYVSALSAQGVTYSIMDESGTPPSHMTGNNRSVAGTLTYGQAAYSCKVDYAMSTSGPGADFSVKIKVVDNSNPNEVLWITISSEPLPPVVVDMYDPANSGKSIREILAIQGVNPANVKEIKLVGELAENFDYINDNMPNLKVLDLGEVVLPYDAGNIYVGHSYLYGTLAQYWSYTGLEKIILPEGLEVVDLSWWGIGDEQSSNGNSQLFPNVKEVVLPSTAKRLSDNSFQNFYSLTTITIPQSVNHIERRVFENCTSLTEVTIPSNVTHIEGGTLRGCTALQKVTFLCDYNSTINSYLFGNPDPDHIITLNVRSSQLNAFKSAFGTTWFTYTTF